MLIPPFAAPELLALLVPLVVAVVVLPLICTLVAPATLLVELAWVSALPVPALIAVAWLVLPEALVTLELAEVELLFVNTAVLFVTVVPQVTFRAEAVPGPLIVAVAVPALVAVPLPDVFNVPVRIWLDAVAVLAPDAVAVARPGPLLTAVAQLTSLIVLVLFVRIVVVYPKWNRFVVTSLLVCVYPPAVTLPVPEGICAFAQLVPVPWLYPITDM